MKQTRFSEEQIIATLKQLETGRTAADLAREVGVSKHTIYARRFVLDTHVLRETSYTPTPAQVTE